MQLDKILYGVKSNALKSVKMYCLVSFHEVHQKTMYVPFIGVFQTQYKLGCGTEQLESIRVGGVRPSVPPSLLGEGPTSNTLD